MLGRNSAARRDATLLRMLKRDSKVSVTDPTGRITEVNDNFCRLSGYSREELLGQPHSIVNSGVHSREFWEEMWRTIAAGNLWRGEICNRAKDGSLYWVDIIVAPIFDAAGLPAEYIALRTDITERKRVEAQLHETSGRFAIATASAGIGVWDFDPVANSIQWDERMYGIYGVAAGGGREPYTAWINALHADDRDRCVREVESALRGETELDTEFRIVRPDGEVRYVKATARTLRAADGSAVRMTGVNIDVTERRRAELGLLETSSMLRTVLDSASETSVVAVDPNLVIKVFNAGAARLLGYRPDEVVDRLSLLDLHDREELRERALDLGPAVEPQTVLTQRSALARERDWTYVRKDGTHVTVSLVVSGMYTLTGELIGYIGVAHDVTRQKQYEESLREATQRAENANRAKSQFLANMSHEIRTPMNAVLGLSYLLTETTLDAEQRRLLSRIQASSNSLLAILNDVLDLTKIEAAELIVESTVFSPYSLLRGICDGIAIQTRAKRIYLHIEVADDLPIAVQGDATRLSQILTNLLVNAVKFTDRGGVTLRVSRVDETPSGVTLRFFVGDTGIGIAPAAQTHLFAPFSQADASITRRYGGTGLGLSIVKSLTDLMGGTISLTSTPGVGSEFTVELTFAPAAPELLAVPQNTAQSPAARALASVRILIVDDSDINLDVTKRILELHGGEVQVANNGLEACDRLRVQPYDFDLVLMDVQMPLLDGYQATRYIRAELGLVDLPIIALTAGALSSERQRAVAAGMDDFIVKPFDAPTLITSILRHVRISALQAATPTEALLQPPPPATVAWPEIAGINLTDARMRLCDDFRLFLANLKRLLNEFSDAASPPALADPEARTAYAARMHKLSGAAGMLGANAIQQLAVDARAACLAGEAKRLARLAPALAVELQRLGQSAEPVLRSAQARAREKQATAVGGEALLTPRQLADLIAALRQHSLSALYRFDDLAAPLRSLLGEESFEIVRGKLENLQFMEAAQLLEESSQRLSPVVGAPGGAPDLEPA
jgi:PAS domain S-box-containing protein